MMFTVDRLAIAVVNFVPRSVFLIFDLLVNVTDASDAKESHVPILIAESVLPVDSKTPSQDNKAESRQWSPEEGAVSTWRASTKSNVAQLSPQQIDQMTRQDLVEVIRAAELPLLPSNMVERLQYRNRETLTRLVYLARRCCRNQGY